MDSCKNNRYNLDYRVVSDTKKFVIDHLSQRQRCIEADNPVQLAKKVEELRQEWALENQELSATTEWHVGSEDINDWKCQEIQKKSSFPSLPNPPAQEYNQSIFESRQTTAKPPQELHIDEYAGFCLAISDADKHRLLNRLPKSPHYPVPEPSFPHFPTKTIALTPRQLPAPPRKCKPTKWYHYLMVLNLLSANEEFRKATEKYGKQKRKVETFNAWLSQLQTDRCLYYEERKGKFGERVSHIKDQWKRAKHRWETTVDEDMTMYQELCSGYESGSPDKVALYFQTHLEAVPLLPCCDKEYETQFEEQEGILLVTIKLPYVRNLAITKTKQLVAGPKIVTASQKEARDIMSQIPFLVVMRIIWEVPKVDYQHKATLIACNGYVVYDDPATGNVRRDVILSIVVKPEVLEQIRLEKVDPEAAFRGLKGIAAARIMELVPVQPLIQFNKHDRRFIAAREIIDHIGNENLATMDWQDFEHLIRELFEKEFGQAGAEVKVTQASRDRGVDAIAFDPDPLRGGKFVIQAKRYTNTVDVSAVRDLYGTVVNEGANRGILVTTSNYGRDAYEFAKDKPITLINGANLLHLLDKHGYHVKIDLKEAKRIMNEGSAEAS
jgi:restriction system protein